MPIRTLFPLSGTAPKLWWRIVHLVDVFETDATARRDFLRYAFMHTAFPLEDWEVEELPTRLWKYRTGIWLREEARMYHDYLEVLVRKLRGEDSSVLTADTLCSSLTVEAFRSEWLGSDSLRDAVAALQAKLADAVMLFNLQYVAYLGARCFHHHDPGLMDIPLCWGIETETGIAQAVQLESLAYGRGKAIYGGPCRTAFDRLGNVPRVSKNFLTFLLLTREQLINMVVHERRGNPDADAIFGPAPREKSVDDTQDRPPLVWMKRSSGLLVPDERQR